MRIPFTSGLLVFRLNCLHHDAKSRFDGGESAPASNGPVVDGNAWTCSESDCGLPVIAIDGGNQEMKIHVVRRCLEWVYTTRIKDRKRGTSSSGVAAAREERNRVIPR